MSTLFQFDRARACGRRKPTLLGAARLEAVRAGSCIVDAPRAAAESTTIGRSKA
jgi:NAD/NADP transhydrogenase alpha subunit